MRKLKMIEPKFFDSAATWVCSRADRDPQASAPAPEVAQALMSLAMAVEHAQSTFLIVDLFPGEDLEVLFVHDIDAASAELGATQNSGPALLPGLSVRALAAIGSALRREMHATKSDMVRYPGEGAEVIVFCPQVRELVLQATGVTLLTQH